MIKILKQVQDDGKGEMMKILKQVQDDGKGRSDEDPETSSG
jgi:hypothetical protein